MVKMVRDITSFSRNGMSDWLIQRVSSIIMLAFVVIIAVMFFMHPQLDYIQWHHLFTQTWMRLGTLLFFLSLLAHAWIGMWTVGTDYLANPYIRLIYQLVVIFVLTACLIYSIYIVWGN